MSIAYGWMGRGLNVPEAGFEALDGLRGDTGVFGKNNYRKVSVCNTFIVGLPGSSISIQVLVLRYRN